MCGREHFAVIGNQNSRSQTVQTHHPLLRKRRQSLLARLDEIDLKKERCRGVLGWSLNNLARWRDDMRPGDELWSQSGGQFLKCEGGSTRITRAKLIGVISCAFVDSFYRVQCFTSTRNVM